MITSLFSLNSIMFLLILISLCCCVGFHPNFKFHYVSINSASPLMLFWSSFTFKFHYVSINSDNVEFTSHATDSPLNSIMFLLILRFIKECKNSFFDFKFHYVSINSYYEAYESNYDITLNSIMFLLIRQKETEQWPRIMHFKFHYVSINS